MTQASVQAMASSGDTPPQAVAPRRSVPREFLDPPGAWNPTVALFLGGYGLAALTVWGWFVGGWPLPLLLITGFLALHLEGTVVHDACHKAAHPVPWINQAMGHGSALLLGFSFPVFTRVHLQHHSHVNDPKNDPDHIVSTFGPLWLIAPRFFYHEVFFFQRKLWKRWELMQWGLERAVFFTIIVAAVRFGFLPFIFNCWFAPALMVGVTLGLFFDYLPHRPFLSRNRWLNARVYPGRTMNWLIMGQNYHLVHHLWPSIPWFEYKPAYEATKPLLDAKGSPQRLGLFETRHDLVNFLYDIFLGVRSHKPHGSKMRPLARVMPSRRMRRGWLNLLQRTAVTPSRRGS
ncbi:Beta-carotene hydroxylase [Synechococcus sp. WH 8101]|uniref:beta-carotene hydroxylase n=1 Tax=Synechococcus sp. WH 8101 TaxID=59932 RepID=UPI0010243B45|nr:Beta-carotene hydroxylase [Synechococcus sp. WH 8101]